MSADKLAVALIDVAPRVLSLQIMHRATLIGWRRAVTLMLADGLRRMSRHR